MASRNQKTLAGIVSAQGTGIHSGADAKVTLLPAPPGSGIRFYGKDGQGGRVESLARAPSKRCTGLVAGAGRIDMVEHLLAAVAICGLTNVDVFVDGPEIPILDGSALPWLRLVEAAGTIDQRAPEFRLAVTRPFQFVHGQSAYCALPGRRKIKVRIDYSGTAIGIQEAEAEESGFDEFSSARTFALKSEIDALKAAGLAVGGSLDNALVLDDDGPLNPGGYRFRNECARHKALDLVGDMMLAGFAIEGEIAVTRPGHEANRAFLAAISASGALAFPQEVAAAA